MAGWMGWLFGGACIAGALLFSAPASADAGLKHTTWELIAQLKRELSAAKRMDFMLLSGTPTVTAEDRRLLAEHLSKLGLSGQTEAQDLVARYRRLRGQRMPFRADPVQISTPAGPRAVCVLKLDYQTPYTQASLLSLLRVDRAMLEQAGLELPNFSVPRLLQHIATHELWHCLEMVMPESYEAFAESLTDVDLGPGKERILPALLRNHAETGADLFATLMDMRNFGGCDMKELMIALREVNLQAKQDVEHYSVPALKALRLDVGPALRWNSLERLVEQVQELRRQGLQPMAFAETWRTVNPMPVSGVK